MNDDYLLPLFDVKCEDYGILIDDLHNIIKENNVDSNDEKQLVEFFKRHDTLQFVHSKTDEVVYWLPKEHEIVRFIKISGGFSPIIKINRYKSFGEVVIYLESDIEEAIEGIIKCIKKS